MSTWAPRRSLRVAPSTAAEALAMALAIGLLAVVFVFAFTTDGRTDFWKLLGVSVVAWAFLSAVESAVQRRRVDRCLVDGAAGRRRRGWPNISDRTRRAVSVAGLLPALLLLFGDSYAAPILGVLLVNPVLVPLQIRELHRFDMLAERHRTPQGAQ